MVANAQLSRRLRFDEFEIDLRSGELWVRGKRVRLQDQPFQVLRVLLERHGELVIRDELKQTLWPSDTFVDFDDGLNTAVRKLRDVLGDSAECPPNITSILTDHDELFELPGYPREGGSPNQPGR